MTFTRDWGRVWRFWHQRSVDTGAPFSLSHQESPVLWLLCSGWREFANEQGEWIGLPHPGARSHLWEVTLCSPSSKCLITEHNRTAVKGSSLVFSNSTLEFGPFSRSGPSAFPAWCFISWLPGQYELEECKFFDPPHNWFAVPCSEIRCTRLVTGYVWDVSDRNAAVATAYVTASSFGRHRQTLG